MVNYSCSFLGFPPSLLVQNTRSATQSMLNVQESRNKLGWL
ncbi:hypothetical protein HanRHA438_Chr12g0545711 [Helianthus annuus]|nr:hypothetical protein HanRHA438_Chr12g0545711 [Helianthus annuus]